MANREPEKATYLTAQELRDMANALRFAAQEIEDAAKLADTHGGGLATYNFKSGELAKDRAASFVSALQKATFAVKSGNPFKDGELKPRSTAKSKTVSEQHAENEAKGVKGRPISELGKPTKRAKRNG